MAVNNRDIKFVVLNHKQLLISLYSLKAKLQKKHDSTRFRYKNVKTKIYL